MSEAPAYEFVDAGRFGLLRVMHVEQPAPVVCGRAREREARATRVVAARADAAAAAGASIARGQVLGTQRPGQPTRARVDRAAYGAGQLGRVERERDRAGSGERVRVELRSPGDELDGAADGIGAVERSRCAA